MDDDTDPDVNTTIPAHPTAQSSMTIIVRLVDWQMTEFLGWKRAAEVHSSIKTIQKEHFVDATSSEVGLWDIM